MKKQVVAVALCAALAVGSLAGCSSNSKETQASGTQANGTQANADSTQASGGTLRVSVSPDFAPYEFEDPSKSGQDKYVGADMELARYIAEQLGMTLDIQPMDFDACLAAVTQGKVDCSISGLYPSDERKQVVDFTDPYFDDAEQLIVVSKDNLEKYSTEESFKGETIAAQNGSAQATIVQDKMKDSKCQLVNKTTDGIQMVRSGKAAGVLLQGVMAKSVIAGDDSLAVSPVTYTNDEAELVIAVKKGNTDLTNKLNEVIKKVNEEKLYDKWVVDAQELASTITDK